MIGSSRVAPYRLAVGPKSVVAPSFLERARRAQIIGCAIDTIADLGYAKASLSRIAQRAETSKSVISYHFGSKDDLVQQIVTDLYAEGAAFMAPLVEAETTAAGKLRAYISSNIQFIGSRPRHAQAVRRILQEYRAPDPETHWHDPLRRSGVEDVQTILRRGQEAGEFRGFSSLVLAVTIRAAIDQVADLIVADPETDVDVCAHELTTVFDLATRSGNRLTGTSQGP